MDPFHLTPCFSVSVGFNSSRVHTQPLPNESVQSRYFATTEVVCLIHDGNWHNL